MTSLVIATCVLVTIAILYKPVIPQGLTGDIYIYIEDLMRLNHKVGTSQPGDMRLAHISTPLKP